MRILILGGDGYLGWPTAMDMSNKNNDVCVVDNYLRRKMAKETNSEPLFENPDLIERTNVFHKLTENKITVEIFDCCEYELLKET